MIQKISFSLLYLILSLGSFSQKIESSNPTFMFVDQERTINYVQEELKDFYEIFCSLDTIPENAKMVDLEFIRGPEIDGIKQLNKLKLFQLDTNKANFESAWRYYPNNEYLNLTYEGANSLGRQTKSMGFVTEKLLDAKPNWRGVVKLLIYTGIIGTYYHLNAEMVTNKEEETEDYYLIGFNVEWHMCTNDCYDIKYRFSVRIDLKTGEVVLSGK